MHCNQTKTYDYKKILSFETESKKQECFLKFRTNSIKKGSKKCSANENISFRIVQAFKARAI